MSTENSEQQTTTTTEGADGAQDGQQPQQGAEAQAGDQPAATDERPARTSREDIYARAKERRDADIAEDPERHAAVSALAGRTAEGAPAAAVEENSQQGVALDSKTIKLTVDGQEVERPIEEVLEAGRRTLQKDHSADLKLRRASAAEQLAAQNLAESERIKAEALKNSGGLPSSGARHDDAGSHPSAQDAGEGAEKVLKEAVSQARDVLFDEGDTDKAVEVMRRSSRDAVVAETNRTFVADFSDIAADPAAMRKAVGLMQAELAKNPSFASIPVIAARIGNQVRTELLAAKVDQAPEQQQQQGHEQQQNQQVPNTDRSAQKVRLPAMPSRATSRTPDTSRPASTQRLTPQQIVHNMRVARGQAKA